MLKQKLFIKMFKEIVKHAEKDNCYYCKELERTLNLKSKLEEMQKEF